MTGPAFANKMVKAFISIWFAPSTNPTVIRSLPISCPINVLSLSLPKKEAIWRWGYISMKSPVYDNLAIPHQPMT